MAGVIASPADSALATRLESLYDAYNRQDSAADPVQIVRRYTDPADQEIVGFCAAALAFGRVASVLNTVETLARAMGPAPAAFVKEFDESLGKKMDRREKLERAITRREALLRDMDKTAPRGGAVP